MCRSRPGEDAAVGNVLFQEMTFALPGYGTWNVPATLCIPDFLPSS
jgi:hypothetical protein